MPASSPEHPSRSLVEAFSEMAARIHSSEDYEDTLDRISRTAAATIACDAASISTLESDGPVSHGITGPLAEHGDRIQYEENDDRVSTRR